MHCAKVAHDFRENHISQIEHSRHRSPQNLLVNMICGLIAYCHQPKKPALPIFPQVLQAA